MKKTLRFMRLFVVEIRYRNLRIAMISVTLTIYFVVSICITNKNSQEYYRLIAAVVLVAAVAVRSAAAIAIAAVVIVLLQNTKVRENYYENRLLYQYNA